MQLSSDDIQSKAVECVFSASKSLAEMTFVKHLRLFCFVLFAFFCTTNAVAQGHKASPRIVQNLNKNWQFVKDKDKSSAWQSINLPHTWNANDVMDDEPGYYRGIGWYKRMFTLEKAWQGKKLFLQFEGANQTAEVFINGVKAGSHIGGYTGFTLPVGNLLKKSGVNELLVKVDNAYNKNIPPLTADFTFYGGLYRDVNLIIANAIHFDHYQGSGGVFVTTPKVTNEDAEVSIRSTVLNEAASKQALLVTSTVYDQEKRKVGEKRTEIRIDAGGIRELTQAILSIKNPKLWSPEQPYLYTVQTTITNKKGEVIDAANNLLGFRWFRFDAANGFFLNGSPYKLVGASRHQDYKGLGNAVRDELAVNDLVLLKKMGGNFLRVAHYPQDPSVMKACDSLGLLASVEIPVVNEITETDSFAHNSETMLVEMIRQNFNHPSVILWCYMNEVLLRPQFNDDKERQKIYFEKIKALAQQLENRTRKEDPSRYTMMANHGSLDQYKKVGLLEIPMVVGWNLYSGWYGGSLEDFPKFLDRFHAAYPQTPMMVTEYGADADPRIHSLQPVRFDKSVEYTTKFHQYYLTEMMKRPFVAAAMIWNLADFNSETRTETMPHINNKGLLEWDRSPKDAYWFYKALLSKQPSIKILGSHQSRLGVMDCLAKTCFHPIQVATNLDSIIIKINGKKQLVLHTKDGLAEGRLAFAQGDDLITAEGISGGKVFRDSSRIEPHWSQTCLVQNDASRQLNVMLGSDRFYTDQKGAWWQPDKAFSQQGWGSVGGKKFNLENNSRLPYGTDKSIFGTDDDPLYQTQQVGIRQYRLDVPTGTYRLQLHFAELVGGKVPQIPYNLSSNERDEKSRRRVFNVKVNGKPFLQQFNIAATYGYATAVVKEMTVFVKEGEGLQVDFEPVEGEPVLNALQLKRLNEQASK